MKHLFLSIFFILIISSCSTVSGSPSATVIPVTSTSTSIPLPTFTSTPSPTPTPELLRPSTSVISKDNLSQLTELGAWGKGVVKNIRWSEDGKQIVIVTSIGWRAYDSGSFQFLKDGFVLAEDTKPKIFLSVDGYDYQSPTSGFNVVVNSDSGTTNSFRVEPKTMGYWPRLTYLPESNVIVIDRMEDVELRDGTSYEVFYKFGGATYSSDYGFQTDFYSAFDVSKDQTIVAAGQLDGSIYLKGGDGFADNLALEAGGPVRFLSFSPDGTKLISENNGSISIWDVSSGKIVGTLPDTFTSGDFYYNQYHFGTDEDLGVTLKENKIAYTNQNNVIILDLLNGKKSGFLDGKKGGLLDKKEDGTYDHFSYQPVHNIFFSADGETVITVLEDRTYIWNISSDQFIRSMAKIEDKNRWELVSVYSASDRLLLIGSQGNNYIKIWNVDDGSLFPSIKAWDIGGLQYGYDGTHSLTISPDGQFVFSWSGLEGVASLWEIKTQKRIMAIKIYGSEYSKYKAGFYPVTISPDNKKLLFTYSSNPDSRLGVAYSIPDGKELYQISQYFSVFSPDGSILASSVGNNRIRFYDSETGNVIGEVARKYPDEGGFQLLYFSEDGKSLIAVGTNGIISIWGIP